MAEIRRKDDEIKINRKLSKKLFHFSENKKRSRSQGCINPFDEDFLASVQSNIKNKNNTQLLLKNNVNAEKTEEIKNLEKELTNLPDFEIDTQFTNKALDVTQKLTRRASTRASFVALNKNQRNRCEQNEEQKNKSSGLRVTPQLSLEAQTNKTLLVLQTPPSFLSVTNDDPHKNTHKKNASNDQNDFGKQSSYFDNESAEPLSLIRPNTLFTFESTQDSENISSPLFSLQLPTSPVHTIPINHRIILKFIGCWAELSKEDFHCSFAMESETLKFVQMVSALGSDYLNWAEKLLSDLELLYPVNSIYIYNYVTNYVVN